MKPLVVAELSASHAQSFERAQRLVIEAANAGASAIKLQTWTPDTMVVADRIIQSGTWAGWSMRDLYAKAHTPWEWHKDLFTIAEELGMEPFSSVFDLKALEFLEKLDCPRYKIASFELVDLELIDAVASTGKSVILSTGMASVDEVADAVMAFNDHPKHHPDLVLLKCTSAYPATAADANLETMRDMRLRFGAHIGLSDHSIGSALAVAAVTLGAEVIEKHLTLSREDGGLDDSFAATPHEFAKLVQDCNVASVARGAVRYGVTPSEESSVALRRSLWLARPIREGEVLRREDLVSARPGEGLPCRLLEKVLGRTIAQSCPAGEPLTAELLR